MGGSNAVLDFSNSRTFTRWMQRLALFCFQCRVLFCIVMIDYCIKQHHLSKSFSVTYLEYKAVVEFSAQLLF